MRTRTAGRFRSSATLRRRPWPSRSRSSRTAARPSVVRSTRSARPRSTRARSATARAVRTGSAPCAAPTLAVEVLEPDTIATATSTRPMAPRSDGAADRHIVVAVDANGADLGPAEVAAGAAIAARQGVRTLLFGPADKFGEIDAPTVWSRSSTLPSRSRRSRTQSPRRDRPGTPRSSWPPRPSPRAAPTRWSRAALPGLRLPRVC